MQFQILSLRMMLREMLYTGIIASKITIRGEIYTALAHFHNGSLLSLRILSLDGRLLSCGMQAYTLIEHIPLVWQDARIISRSRLLVVVPDNRIAA